MENPYSAPKTLPPVQDRTDLADHGARFLAVVIDYVINLAVTGPILTASGYFEGAYFNGPTEYTYVEVGFLTVLNCVVYVLLHSYLLATRGQTIGKYLVGIQVVDYVTGDLLSVGKILGVRVLPVLLVNILPLGSIFLIVDGVMIFGENRRCLHDLIAGTKVVKLRGQHGAASTSVTSVNEQS